MKPDHARPGSARPDLGIEIKPFPAALGAEVLCGDARNNSDADWRTIHQALLDHLFLLIRGQTFGDDDLLSSARHFGEIKKRLPDSQRAANVKISTHPDIGVISNVIENGVAIGNLGDGEALWHTDFNFDERPYAAILMYSLELPATGGDTSWSNMYAAYDTLPAELRERIKNLTIKHDQSYNAANILRSGYSPVTDVRAAPGPSHPIVRTHPDTGRNCLYLGRRLNAYVNGLELQESERLLDELWAHAEKPEFQWRHQWRVGDLVIWDNRCTMHHREAFDPKARRIMHRTQTQGDRPCFSRAADDTPHPRAGRRLQA